MLQGFAFGEFENRARPAIDFVANGPAAQRIPPASSAHLEFEQQVEVTELGNPPVLTGQRSHPAEIVHDECLNARRDIGRECGKDSPPARRRFVPRKQHRIEEDGVLSATRFHRHEIQHPWVPIELEPEAIRQQHQWAGGNAHQRRRLRHESLQDLSEAIAIRGKRDATTSRRELGEREAAHEDTVQQRRRVSVNGTATLPWPNPPRPSAGDTLPTSLSKPTNSSSATW